jgi:asparagine synthetase B (glutamine-hydrolysing)
MKDFDLTPVTRNRLLGIFVFLLFDAVVSLYIAVSDPFGTYSLYAFGAGFIFLVCSLTVAVILIVDRFDIGKALQSNKRERI